MENPQIRAVRPTSAAASTSQRSNRIGGDVVGRTNYASEGDQITNYIQLAGEVVTRLAGLPDNDPLPIGW